MKPVTSTTNEKLDPVYVVLLMQVCRVFGYIAVAAICVFLFISLWLGIGEFFARWDLFLNNINDSSLN